MRVFTCKACGESWETDRPGRFTSCSPCKEKALQAKRTKVCGYRNCGETFYDDTPKSSRRYCSDRCGHREKMFRTGSAKDESYFRVTLGPKCQTCGERFAQREGENNIRCPACRDAARDKICRKCSSPFRDESKKNTRRYCGSCSAAPRIRKIGVTRGPRKSVPLSALRPYTNSWWGRVGEVLFLHLYPLASDSNEEYGRSSPFDGLHPSLGRVQVRTAKARQTGWSFQLGSDSADTYFLLGFSEAQDEVVRGWIAPSESLPRTLAVMSPESREYDRGALEFGPEIVALLDRLFQTIRREAARWKAPRKPSRTTYPKALLGRLGESLYAQENPESDHVSRRDPSSPYDFLDPGEVRVDVKSRTLTERGEAPRWTFFYSAGSAIHHCYGFDRLGKEVLAAFRIPSEEMPPAGFSVPFKGRSKWDRYRVPPPSLVSPPSEEVSLLLEIDRTTRESYDALSDADQLSFQERVLRYYQSSGFPYPEILSDEEFTSECEEIRGTPFPEGGEFPLLRGGTRTLSSYMPHRYEARNANADFSAVGAFGQEERLGRAIRFCLRHGKPDVSPDALRRTLCALNRTPGHFSPKLAYALVSKFCPEGGTVLDPCAGWGGRLLGTTLAGRSYVGVEPEDRTYAALHRVGERLRNLLGLPLPTLHHAGIQDLDLPLGSVDFALTSPPFWTQEVYGEEGGGTLEEWVEGFLVLMLTRVWKALRVGGVFGIHVATFRQGGHLVDLEALVREEAETVGFTPDATLWIRKPSFGSKQEENRRDPLLVFRR